MVGKLFCFSEIKMKTRSSLALKNTLLPNQSGIFGSI